MVLKLTTLCRKKMALVGLLFLVFLSLGSCVYGYGGGWINAHATFYGGGDASGTMGKSQNLCSKPYLQNPCIYFNQIDNLFHLLPKEL